MTEIKKIKHSEILSETNNNTANDDILLSIKCLVYNHEAYIRQCLDSFVMQKTNFKFEAIVHDDASTDNTAAIIREYAQKYPDIIKPIFQSENQYSKKNGLITKTLNAATKGKYIALCEGDDYWTDEYKLQKQVDFLEANPDYGLVYTKTIMYLQDENRFTPGFGSDQNDINTLLVYNCIPTLTTCFRTSVYNEYMEFRHKENLAQYKWKMGDYPMWLYFASHSKCKFIDENTACYRVLSESASHSHNIIKQIEFYESTYSIQKFYCKYLHKKALLRKCRRQLLRQISNLSIKQKEWNLLNKYLRKYRPYRPKNIIINIFSRYNKTRTFLRNHIEFIVR